MCLEAAERTAEWYDFYCGWAVLYLQQRRRVTAWRIEGCSKGIRLFARESRPTHSHRRVACNLLRMRQFPDWVRVGNIKRKKSHILIKFCQSRSHLRQTTQKQKFFSLKDESSWVFATKSLSKEPLCPVGWHCRRKVERKTDLEREREREKGS